MSFGLRPITYCTPSASAKAILPQPDQVFYSTYCVTWGPLPVTHTLHYTHTPVPIFNPRAQGKEASLGPGM